MAPPKAASRRRVGGRPGRPLIVVLIAIIAMYGVMFGIGEKTPRLGIDLAGGTSVTLKAVSEPGKPNAVNSTNMKTAVSILNKRVNGFGVSEAQVQTEGSDNIVINVPAGGSNENVAKEVGKTAKLYFRPVLVAQTAGAGAKPTTSPSPSPNASGTASTSPKATTSPSANQSGGAKKTGAAASGAASTQPSDRASSSAANRSKARKALAADVSKSPKATTSPKSTSSPKAGASPKATSTAAAASTIPASLKKKLAEVDCKTYRPGSYQPAKKDIVACSQDPEQQADGSKAYTKMILGPVAVDGTKVTKAQAQLDQNSGAGWEVVLTFDSKGTKQFAKTTGALVSKQSPQNQFAIVLDGEVVSHPYVQNAITAGNAQISGNFTQSSANDLANVLKYGALPLSFEQQDVTTVSPSLGGNQLEAGLLAGMVGLFLVVLYSIAYYRGLAFVSIASLLCSALLTYAIMTLLGTSIGFALSLPGICGAIVAIGITADSFIVYFERIRDELREGRTLRPAVERGWPRARRTILVSDFVSFLAAAVLYIVSVGTVKGFAFTLGLTTILDVVVVFLFTKPLITLLVRRPFFAAQGPWSGLDPHRLGIKKRTVVRRKSGSAGAKEA